MRHNIRFLYSVWRNSDDKLMILDGNAEECAAAMGVTMATFRTFCNKGGNGDWTITKKSIREIENDING